MKLPSKKYDMDEAARAEVLLSLPTKLEQYLDPSKFGIILNAEGVLFNECIQLGFVDPTLEGLETLLAWMAVSTTGRIEAELFEFQAFLMKHLNIPVNIALESAKSIVDVHPIYTEYVKKYYGMEYNIPEEQVEDDQEEKSNEVNPPVETTIEQRVANIESTLNSIIEQLKNLTK